MRILITASTFPRWPDDELPDFVWRQVQALNELCPDVEVTVLAPHDRGAATHETWRQVRIRRFRYVFPSALQRLAYPAIWPNLKRSPWLLVQVPFFLIAEFFATLRFILSERPAVVYSHWFMPQGVACGLAALATGTKHVFTSHSQDVAVLRNVPLLGPWIVRFLTRRAHAATAVSSRTRSAIAKFFESDEWECLGTKVAVIPMGVDLEEWHRDLQLASADDLPDGVVSPTILFVGRLAAKKGIADLLAAMQLEPLSAIDPCLVIAGSGPQREPLEQQVRDAGLDDRVFFPGFVSGVEKAAYFRTADVVALPSVVTEDGDAEGLPVVLLESLAAGNVIVASDASNAGELIKSGEQGFIVPERDPHALASSLAGALTLSPERLRTLRRNARRTARDFAWPVIARRHAEHLFGDLCEDLEHS